MRGVKRYASRKGQSTRTAMLFLAPSLAGVAIFVLLPFGDALRRSLFDAMGNNFTGLANYKSVFANEAFKLAATNTAKFVAVCIPLLIVVSLVLALLILNVVRGREFFKSVLLLPMAIPVASVVLLFKMLFHADGIVNGIFGLELDWLNSSGAFLVLVGSYIWKNAGYDMILWIAGLSGIPSAIYEAASVDGAGAWQSFWRITVPNMMPTLYIITVLSFINSFKVFREAYLLAGSYPHESIFMLQHLFNNWFTALDVQKLCAAAVIVALVLMAVILLLQKLWDKE